MGLREPPKLAEAEGTCMLLEQEAQAAMIALHCDSTCSSLPFANMNQGLGKSYHPHCAEKDTRGMDSQDHIRCHPEALTPTPTPSWVPSRRCLCPHLCGSQPASAAGLLACGVSGPAGQQPPDPEPSWQSHQHVFCHSSPAGHSPPCRHHQWSPPGGKVQVSLSCWC